MINTVSLNILYLLISPIHSVSLLEKTNHQLVSQRRCIFSEALDKQKVRGLVPCCGQDGYLAQVSQHPIDSTSNNLTIPETNIKTSAMEI